MRGLSSNVTSPERLAPLTNGAQMIHDTALQRMERQMCEGAAMPLDDNFFSPSAIADPYPLQHQLRAAEPIHWRERSRVWMLTQYDHVLSAFRDPRLLAEDFAAPLPAYLAGVEREYAALRAYYRRWVLFEDPPAHTRLRSLMNKAFTPRVVEQLAPRIQVIVDNLLDGVQRAGGMDIIRDLAYPLPVIVIAELLGVPAEEREQFKRWCDEILAPFSLGTAPDPAAVVRRGYESTLALDAYFGRLMAARRREPTPDLLSALVHAQDQGMSLSEAEVAANCAFLLFAGHETTANLIGNGMLALLRHPDQLQQLRNEPALISGAIEELLRYDSPVQFQVRIAAEEIAINGTAIRKGERMWLMQGAANRDPAQFPHPDRLDLRRQPNRHLAFGYGMHFCIGAPLARLEGQTAIRSLLQRMPALRLASDTVSYHPHVSFRGLTALPATF